MENQLYVFFVFILTGFLIGILFDIFRIIRKTFKSSDIVTYIQDSIFWILTGLLLLFCLFKFNNGELRLYIFIGIISGFSIYILVFSKLFISISMFVIKVIKKIITYIIIIPLKYISKILRKTIFKPITFCIINIRKSIYNIFIKIKKVKKLKKFTFNKEISNKKKDFT